MGFDKVHCGSVLKIVSTVGAGMFAGGAFYISAVESAARNTHDPPMAITMWKPSFLRAKAVQSKLAMLSSVSSLSAFACLRNETEDALKWLGAGCAMLSIIPITLIFIRPLNNQLLETEKCISVKGDQWITASLNQWRKLHTVRTIVSLGAFSFMVCTLYKC